MPVAITVYKCEHCGKRRLANKSKVAEHEKICWYNPSNNCCPTCLHHSYEESESYCEEFMKVRKFYERPVVNCSKWKDRELQEDL